jgi:hypothetical protein
MMLGLDRFASCHQDSVSQTTRATDYESAALTALASWFWMDRRDRMDLARKLAKSLQDS